jgi:hypothetical protein
MCARTRPKACNFPVSASPTDSQCELASDARKSPSSALSLPLSRLPSIGERMTVPVRRIEPAVLKLLFVDVVPKSATYCLVLYKSLVLR